MAMILKKLAAFCGPLVLYEQAVAAPLVIMPTTDVDAAMEDWSERIRQRMLKMTTRGDESNARE
jgi:hypothetical protein